VIALVNVRGNVEGSRHEVLRSWKAKLPRWIDVPQWSSGGTSCAYGVGADGIYLLYLHGRQGTFSSSKCAGNLHESNPEFRSRIDWLDNFGIPVE
jgi:hypothetical protein